MISRRNAKQRKAEAGEPLSRNGYWGAGKTEPGNNSPKPGSKLIFKPGTAAIAGVWEPGSDGDPPATPHEQP